MRVPVATDGNIFPYMVCSGPTGLLTSSTSYLRRISRNSRYKRHLPKRTDHTLMKSIQRSSANLTMVFRSRVVRNVSGCPIQQGPPR